MYKEQKQNLDAFSSTKKKQVSSHSYSSDNSRELLLHLLNECEHNTLNNSLEKLFQLKNLSIKEKAFITNLSHQVFRFKLRFESLIRLYCHKHEDISKYTKNILLLALCEMFCMQSIPLHASLYEAVQLAKKYSPKEAALVNGVLRKVDSIFPNKELNKVKFLKEIKFLYPKKTLLELEATYASLPSFILDIIRKQEGKEKAEEYLKNLNKIPLYSYRFNKSMLNWKDKVQELSSLDQEENEIPETAFITSKRPAQIQELYEQGFLSSHGISSQIAVSKILDFINPNIKIWDACSGVGGKSLALAEQGASIVCASDISKKRIDIYKQECLRLNLKEIPTEITSLQDAHKENCACILLDAPCSGIGTLCANPDLRYKITKKSIQEVVTLQKELLASAFEKLSFEGLLIYLTCSLNKFENEMQIEEYIQNNKAICLHSEYISPSIAGADTLYLAIIQKQIK